MRIEQDGVQARALRAEDVDRVQVARVQRALRRAPRAGERVAEDRRVGLLGADERRIDDVVEQSAKARVAQLALDAAVGVADDDDRQPGLAQPREALGKALGNTRPQAVSRAGASKRRRELRDEVRPPLRLDLRGKTRVEHARQIRRHRVGRLGRPAAREDPIEPRPGRRLGARDARRVEREPERRGALGDEVVVPVDERVPGVEEDGFEVAEGNGLRRHALLPPLPAPAAER